MAIDFGIKETNCNDLGIQKCVLCSNTLTFCHKGGYFGSWIKISGAKSSSSNSRKMLRKKRCILFLPNKEKNVFLVFLYVPLYSIFTSLITLFFKNKMYHKYLTENNTGASIRNVRINRTESNPNMFKLPFNCVQMYLSMPRVAYPFLPSTQRQPACSTQAYMSTLDCDINWSPIR